MNEIAIANRLSAIGKEEAALMRKLMRIQVERCTLLQIAATMHGDDAIVSLSVEPKEP